MAYTAPRSTDITITGVTPESWTHVVQTLSAQAQTWAQQQQFSGKPKQVCILPSTNGHIEKVLWGMDTDPWSAGALASKLPSGTYQIDAAWQGQDRNLAILSWGLEHYRFDRYRSNKDGSEKAMLSLDDDTRHWATTWIDSIGLVRDLINTPCADLNPKTLAEQACQLANDHGATCTITEGDALLDKGFRAIHAVGRAGQHAPCLIDLQWGDKGPQITLVGKGVCFDSGGLDIKTAAGMRQMKKDMGGAAHALGLAHHIMTHQLPVRLRVLIPAVENGIDRHAYRPGDIITTYSGKTVEVDNTDAEGRLILADALSLACQAPCDLLIDFATLTGAARIAMGPTLPAMFSQDEDLAHTLLTMAEQQQDPMWRLPLYAPYNSMIQSDLADIKNTGGSPYGGAITAALFLQQFVKPKMAWAHFDIMAANLTSSPGKPKGGEAMALRAVYAMIKEKAEHAT